MSDSETAIGIYDAQASMLAARYDDPALLRVHDPILNLLPENPVDALALDVGAGSGRDAAWLVTRGYQVVAVEPAAGMRAEGQRRHPDPAIRWLDDRLPSLAKVHGLGLAYDLIQLAAVWQHIAPADRPRAFRKLVTLLKPGGLMILSLRDGPPPANRPMFEVSLGEIEGLARVHGLEVLRATPSGDRMGRGEVRWTHVVLRMPDDGSGALPLIRGIVLADDKSSTYKLALLRAVARIADVAPATARPSHDEADTVEVPLGLVALNWVRMYLPLVRAGLPQAPRNSGPDGLGFAKSGFRALLADGFAALDLRPGASFTGDRAAAVASAISEAATTIANMPANFTRYPGTDRRVFGASKARTPRSSDTLTLDVETLRKWGSLSVPGPVWRTLTRLGAWVEPVLITEWARLMRGYADRMSRPVALGTAEAALAWEEPLRDTVVGRAAAERLLAQRAPVSCVWSGQSLNTTRLDIDHCLPWSAWPCGDLWNLMPADRRINQNHKRDRLPSQSAMAGARPLITSWWQSAWIEDPALGARFLREADAALPIEPGASLDDIFTALDWRRLRLRQDQQVPEWNGPLPSAAGVAR
ncbi:methyltransferase type 11 [Nostoc sp. 3335mG]|nr:methyltransferase type 11 [Nostoc sp. 3335mG]